VPRAALCLAFVLAAGLPVRAQQQSDDLDSVLGGFEHEEPAPAAEGAGAADERIWDLSGSVELSGSVNYRSHRSDTGTDYQGLQRLRNRANLQLDVDLSSLASRAQRAQVSRSEPQASEDHQVGERRPSRGPRTIFEIDDLGELAGAPIATDSHCFGCTAGSGSSCGGALA